MLDRVFTESKRYVMHTNERKTKTMVFGKRPEENDAEVCVNGNKIENMDPKKRRQTKAASFRDAML